MNTLNLINSEILEEIKKRLVEVYNPETIYLFGSHVWGSPGNKSDLDLAVIIKNTNESPYLRSQKGTMALWNIDLPVDLMVYTMEEFDDKVQYRSTLQFKIKKEGIVIYEAA